jgi:hypothetical protein
MVKVLYHQKTQNWKFWDPETERFYPFTICSYWGDYHIWHRGPSSSSSLIAYYEELGPAVDWIMQAIQHM